MGETNAAITLGLVLWCFMAVGLYGAIAAGASQDDAGIGIVVGLALVVIVVVLSIWMLGNGVQWIADQ